MSETENPRIVLVDDEDMVITSIRAYLMLETEYEVEGFTDPENAVTFLASTRADVVISDFLMPKLSGLDLLKKAKELQPEAARVLLTGHADKQSAIHAINDVGLYQFLEKPWDNAQLLLVINGALERTRLLRELESKISELDSAHNTLKEAQRRLIRAFL